MKILTFCFAQKKICYLFLCCNRVSYPCWDLDPDALDKLFMMIDTAAYFSELKRDGIRTSLSNPGQ